MPSVGCYSTEWQPAAQTREWATMSVVYVRMCVCACVRVRVCARVPSETQHYLLIEQHTHQLHNAERGVRVIELNGNQLSKLLNGTTTSLVSPNQVLDGGAHEEVLLLQAQFLVWK